ncbi:MULTISPECIES: SusC/RagA family TonB-linked outer membrane protein [Chryseobacterium]|uniref:TonB-linked outer membrane protein, SusC/RagA family n=1 Tax=Chryseobacterium gambrini TaxID=373672 RepID=A0A1N7KKR9_9FLAO|nr:MULTISPECIES: TonB-dependent receptor [Chryseobacterium]MCQ4140182.1 TonB-dependent receptor [Chryseobacterium sp. EO14]PTT78285.1 TonB-dependent receptor [Chryseobacterium sp. HMWF001]PVV53486.1 TonB-dependent receptor [Chryseobacterium sp. HMWF035]SIS62178.1 TonB-linked outer membrane protein, SusC/RagA family [Chryseobacterium gambrini]
MNVRISRSLGMVAVLYFTANFNAQNTKTDTLPKEQKIEEVVMIGYGTQKKSNVTGAISSIKASDIEAIPAGKPEQVLQGRAAGVNVISNSGQPGSSATIRVRGITSFGASNDPLWVVDGIVVDGIGWLNQSDIENIEVLKDGASSAIYGVSAARGVILVTTKKGKKGRLNLSYNGFYGFGHASRKLDLLNATQYATILNEAYVNAGQTPKFANPQSLGEGTNWQDVIFNTGERSNHEVSISGGNEKSTFYGSFGYYDQTGIVMSDISYYKRLTARLNSTHKVTDWLTLGQTFAYTHTKSQGINSNGEFGGPLSSAVNLDPTTPILNPDLSAVPAAARPFVVRNQDGIPYGISSLVQNEMSNPLAFKYTQLGNHGWSDDFIANIFAEVKITKDLTFKSSINGKKAYWGSWNFTPLYYLNANYSNLGVNSLSRTTQEKFEWSLENTLNYQKRFGKHNLNLLAGNGYYEYNIGLGQSVTHSKLPISNWEDASFNFDVGRANQTVSAWDYINTHKVSYFGRVVYDYDNKYLLTGTVRRDGSSKFGANQHWGTFPAFSLGWNVNNENFWPENKIINTLKLRGGYGILGNDGIDDFQFASFYVSGANYTGYNSTGEEVILPGYYPNTLANPDLKWETTSQMNFAADIKFLNNFNLTVDYYKKKTSDILRKIFIPGYVGVTNAPTANIGDMENEGVEVELGYKKNWSDWGVSVNGNFAYLKNTVTRLERGRDYIDGPGFQSMGPVSRLQVGESYGSFYGYNTLGIFQNQAQINSYVNANGQMILPNAKPGDFIWADTNGDGVITDADKVNLGNSVPKFTFGMTVNLNYKNWDLMVFAQGQAGNKIFQGLRRLDLLNANYQTAILDRWTGEGTSNTTPRVTVNDTNHNYTWMSNYYLQKGDYVRIKLVQLGYTLPQSATQNFGVNKLRLYVTGENLFTFTKYTGYDPEIAAGDSFGIDRAYYPQARTFIFGANITF